MIMTVSCLTYPDWTCLDLSADSLHLSTAEHVFEKHIIKHFLHFLIGGMQAFDKSTIPGRETP